MDALGVEKLKGLEPGCHFERLAAGGCSPPETRAGAVGGTVVVVEIQRRNARGYAILENAPTFVSLRQ